MRSIGGIYIKGDIKIVIPILGLDFVVDVTIEFLAIFDGEINNNIQIYNFVGIIYIETVHFEDAWMGKDNIFYIFTSCDATFIFGIYGIDTNRMNNDTVFFHDIFRDAARHFIYFVSSEGIGNFYMDGAEIFVWTVISEDKIKDTFYWWLFGNFFFDFAGKVTFYSGAENIINRFPNEVNTRLDDEGRYEDADIGFDVKLPNHINNSGSEDGDGK